MATAKKIRAKFPKKNLNNHQRRFCRLMAEGMSSIEAYNNSHHTVNKVRASTYLQNTFIWDEIILIYRTQNKEMHLVVAYDRCIEITGQAPTRIFYDYFQNKEYFDANDNNPLYVLKRMCACWEFFQDLEREYFINRIIKGIKEEYDMLCILISKNPEWTVEFDSFRKEMCKQNINFSNILKFDINGSTERE